MKQMTIDELVIPKLTDEHKNNAKIALEYLLTSSILDLNESKYVIVETVDDEVKIVMAVDAHVNNELQTMVVGCDIPLSYL